MTSRSSFFTRCLAFGLVLALTPGLAEAVENVWHLALLGHSAHATDEGSDHQPTGDEHGCSGTFHVCSCHHASSVLPVSPTLLALNRTGRGAAVPPLLPRAPFRPGLLRPPQS